MDSSSTERYERVRGSLLHLGLRQITEEPGPDQPANFARRRARFKQYRQELDDLRAKQSAARSAAEVRVDSELRARLLGVNKCDSSHHTRKAAKTSCTTGGRAQPVVQMQDEPPNHAKPASRRSSSRVFTGRAGASFSRPDKDLQPTPQPTTTGASPLLTTNTTASPANGSAQSLPNSAALQAAIIQAPVDVQSRPNKLSHGPTQRTSARILRSTGSNLVDRTKADQADITGCTASTTSPVIRSSTIGSSAHAGDEEAAHDSVFVDAISIPETPSPATCDDTFPNRVQTGHRLPSPRRRRDLDIDRAGSIASSTVVSNKNGTEPGRFDEEHGANKPFLDTASDAANPGCTSKHFRVRRITGRDSIDGDTYYVVSWKSSWVPSDQIMAGDDGQDRYIKIDGKDWRIATTIKSKIKKGTRKELVRWVDDTLEPIKRLQRALPAIEAFELKPRLERRVVSFGDSLIDLAKVLPQSDEEFRKAQVHLAEKWPMIAPRNDIDLLPAFRQIMLEQYPRRDDDTANRKTHQRLIDQPQLRRLCWSEEYILSGRFYECTAPKRNALLLQVVAEGVGNGWCERCVSDTAPFKECARDISEGSPWLNGACANCGTAEANSTCCHHLVGTAHLERGRSSGLNSERLKEFIDPTREIGLLKLLQYEKDDDSDTYSADSYAESDNSSVCGPGESDDGHYTLDDGDDQDEESTNNNFWTPGGPRSQDQLHSTRRQSTTEPANEQESLFLSPSAQPDSLSEVPKHVRMQDRSISQDAAALPTPDVTQAFRFAAAVDSSRTGLQQNSARRQERQDYIDRSSVTLAAGSPVSSSHNGTYHDVANDGRSGSYQLFDPKGIHRNMDSLFVKTPTPQDLSARSTASPNLITMTGSRLAVVQTVEASDQRLSSSRSWTQPPSLGELRLSSAGPKTRKRAASQPSEDERSSTRQNTDSSGSSRGASEYNAVDVEDHRTNPSSAGLLIKSRAETKIDRGSTHDCCRANWPCIHPDNATPDNGTFVPVYRDSIDGPRQLSIGEVQYILSRSTCHWASAFTKVWDGWCEIESTPVDAALAKPQFLLSAWPEFLLDAAKECCPSDPDNRVVITID